MVLTAIIVCVFIVSATAQTCSLFCGPGQICQYVGFQPTCVPYSGGIGWGHGSGWLGSRWGRRGWIDPTFSGVGAGFGVAGVGAGIGVGGFVPEIGVPGVGTGLGVVGVGAGIGVAGVAGGAGLVNPIGVGLESPNLGVVNKGGIGPAVVDNQSGQTALNLNIQNNNVNQHTHSGSGGVQVNDPFAGAIGHF